MRDHEAHEADQPADRDRRGRCERREAEQDRPLPANVDAEVGGGLLAQQEAVQDPGAKQDGPAGDEDERRRNGEPHPRGSIESAEEVAEDLPEAGPGEVHGHGQPGRQERPHGITGQDEAGQWGERAGPAQAIHRPHGEQRSGKCEPVQKTELEHEHPHRDHDRDGRAECSPRGRPQDVRVGQRIAQQPLERRPGDRQPEADDHGLEHPRQAQVEDDRLGGRRPRLGDRQAKEPAAQDPDRVERRHRDRPERNAEDQGHEQADRTRGEQENRAAGPVPPHGDAMDRDSLGVGGHGGLRVRRRSRGRRR